MTYDKVRASSGARGEPVRRRVIDAAERLLRDGNADFSMRDLAAEAGVSFATPFNQFGGKAAIMHALSHRRIDTMIDRFQQAGAPARAADRVLLATDIAAGVMLEEPGVNRAVMGWVGSPGPASGGVLDKSTAFWLRALGKNEENWSPEQELVRELAAQQLAFGFRGVLSFWTAGELPDDALAVNAREVAASLLRGFAERL